MIPSSASRQLPKAKLLSLEWSTNQFYFAKFRLANAIRWQIGPIAIVHRASWLEHSARQLHPHLFGDTK